MDLQQRKLTKSEWESVEIPISTEEKKVLQMIIDGYDQVNIRVNYHLSLFGFLKIEYNEVIEDYLYNKYFNKKIEAIFGNIKIDPIIKSLIEKVNPTSNHAIKKADSIRLQKNTEESLEKVDIYESVLIRHFEKIIKYVSQLKKKHQEFEFHYFTLYKLIKNNISHLNRHVQTVANIILNFYKEKVNFDTILINSPELVEKNINLLKYADLTLYEHQKEIFTIFQRKSTTNLVLYIAPTGTGKTLTPIALSQTHRIIFVCAARHVGVSLAKSAISMNKKIAFAFGCGSAEDIRLHYFAAINYTKDWRTGGIRKVDNSNGEKVEIIICDIKSYLPAMYYMCSFNDKSNIITYWDEPTITMDYEKHEIHEIIQKNWKENLIPNMVLSSATLPKLHELTDVIADFKGKFPDTQVTNIVSHDCKKSIPIINNNGYVVLPHLMSENYDEVMQIAINCEKYLTLLRYFDLFEVVEFIKYVAIDNKYVPTRSLLSYNFETLDDFTMKNIKLYYLKLLKNVIGGTWGAIAVNFKINRKQKITANQYIDSKGNKNFKKMSSVGPGIIIQENSLSGKPISRVVSETSKDIISSSLIKEDNNCAVYVTTKDAYTLTDGPTIFLADDVEKISKFCIQQANIPVLVMDEIMKKIEFNNSLNEKIADLESNLEYLTDASSVTAKDGYKLKKENRDEDKTGDKNKITLLKNQIMSLKIMTRSVSLNDTFVPNSILHLKKWAEELNITNAFTSHIDESIVNEIMLLHGVEDTWKVLLMMGIGVFTNDKVGVKINGAYTEIMKKLADNQKLYMIIASSDYIYGTNYQFCHGYLSKDLCLTQEKIIQAMGRIGRSNVQQNYTVRFRDNDQIKKLFSDDSDKPEVRNMNRLLSSNVV